MSNPRCWIDVIDPDTKQPVAVQWADVMELSVENTLYIAADSFEMTLKNDRMISDYLRKEMEVRIYLGYVHTPTQWNQSELTQVFCGKIDGVRPTFNKQMTVRLIGRDWSAPLIDNEFSIAFAERTAAQIAQMLAEKHGLTPQITATTVIIERDLYKDRKEWEILQELADREGFVCYVKKDKALYFGPRNDQDNTVVADLFYRQKEQSNLISIEFDDSVVGIINRVIVRHWMGKHKTLIEGTAKNDELIKKYGEKTRIVYDPKAKTKELADQIAAKHLKEWSRAVVTGEQVQLEGSPALVAEKMVSVTGSGRFDGRYYIDRVRHRFNKSAGYQCELNITSQRPDSAAQYRKDLYNFHERTM